MKRVGDEYAKGLYDLARDENLTDQILQEMKMLQKILAGNPEYLRILSAPNISKEERCTLLSTALKGRVHPYVLNFLKILTEKGYARFIPDTCSAYECVYNEDHGILPVLATTAIPMSEAQMTKLSGKLATITGKKIALSNRVDPVTLGGVRLDFDGRRMDDSVRHRLDALRSTLEKTTL